ncbi:MAG: hypothetical protein LC725_05640 [Lentisphaerae bacterium]|nr:hypothetical protein [Lentisphaerota bacterium]
MKKIIAMVAAVGFVASSSFGAMLEQGTRELGVAGQWNRDSVAGFVSFGQFVADGLILGVSGNGGYNDFGNDADARTWGGSLFAQYHLDVGAALVPFVGLAGGAQFMKLKAAGRSESDTGWFGEGQAGVKTFISNNIAVAIYGYYTRSDKEIFTNKDELNRYDYGMRVGMNSYF